MKTLSIDVMGGDFGVNVTIPAVLSVLQTNSSIRCILVGNAVQIKSKLSTAEPSIRSRLDIVETTEVVAMDESPSKALRTKKDASMRVALNLVKNGAADACVSAGNTGALMAMAKFVLKTIPGISRPAILTRLPTVVAGQVTRVLDLGANVEVSADQLVQFAVMGSVLAEAAGGIKQPRVGLVNVGQEDIKGSALIQQAHAQLQQVQDIGYIGFIEGHDWFSGQVDVAVCDGFVGNIALKAVEGVTSLMFKSIVGNFEKNLYSRLSGLLARPVLQNVKSQLDPRTYNGASFVGLNGVVIKSHGSADQFAFTSAINEAILEIYKAVPQRIKSKVNHVLTV